MIDFAERHHAFEACFNFRDIGGYSGVDGRTVRWGRYFRAGRQDRMTAADIDRVGKLKISTQIDLRRPDEVEDHGRGPLEGLGAQYEILPVIPLGGSQVLNQNVGAGISGERYLGYLDFDTTPMGRIFEILATADQYPVVVHCTAGKDRTGVISALTLLILGVDRSVIEEDYALTNRDVERHIDFVAKHDGLPDNVSHEGMVGNAGVPEEAIGVFLDGLDREHGGAMAFLQSIGVNDKIQESIREALLESA